MIRLNQIYLHFFRSFYFTFEKSINQKGFNYYRFVLSNTSFNAPSSEPENSCYCTRDENIDSIEGFCTENGILDISHCNDNKPLFASAPHFYQGSELLLSRTKLKPNKKIHQTYTEVDPVRHSPLCSVFCNLLF